MGTVLYLFTWGAYAPLFLPLLIAIIIIIIRYALVYKTYKSSAYKEASGNSFFNTAFNIGNYGEFLTYRILEKLTIDKKLLTNIYIPKEDGTTTETDLVMICEAGIFAFESKNYSGWIFGDEKSKMWTQTLKNRKKNRFYNPIWQNKAHITAMKSLLKDVEDGLFHSYIIFSDRCELKNVKVNSQDIRLIKRNQLLSMLNRDLNILEKRLTKENVETIYNTFAIYGHADEIKKKQHIEGIKRKMS